MGESDYILHIGDRKFLLSLNEAVEIAGILRRHRSRQGHTQGDPMTAQPKPTRIPNSKAREFVQAKQEFQGSNTLGLWDAKGGPRYVVYSYGAHWPMFIFDRDSARWYENKDKYSRTTSKQHGQLHPLVETFKCSVGDMRALAWYGVAEAMAFKLNPTGPISGKHIGGEFSEFVDAMRWLVDYIDNED